MSASADVSPRGLALISGMMPEWAERGPGARVGLRKLLPARVGQVCFMKNPVTGLAILVATFVAEVWLGFADVLGLVVSTGLRS